MTYIGFCQIDKRNGLDPVGATNILRGLAAKIESVVIVTYDAEKSQDFMTGNHIEALKHRHQSK